MLRKIVAPIAICLILIASVSQAGTITAGTVANANSEVANFDTNFKTNDIKITTPAGQSIGSLQVLAQLTTGSVYNHGNGGNTPPSASFLGFVPALAFDTFVAAGAAALADGSSPVPLIFGASDTLGGPGGAASLTGTRVDATFSPAAGQATSGVTNWLASRLTFSSNANGTFKFIADFGGGNTATLNAPIINGVVGVPEPATISLIGLAMFGVVGMGRRRS